MIINSNNLGIPIAIVVSGLFVSVALYFGLQGFPPLGGQALGTASGTETGSTAGVVATQIPQPTQPSNTKISVDDDPVLGNPDAPVTVIEFSDYECPFCKRSFDDMLVKLKAEYVATGKVKMVLRDFPLSFHEPKATEEAVAANCAREQGGDSVYVAYHNKIFAYALSNGAGTSKSLSDIAVEIGIDRTKFESCIANNDYEAEVQKDISDGNAAFVGGTPTYYVGKSSPDGIIDAQIIVGAVPYESIKPVIESYLN